jgi:hypothetical protein
LDREPPEAVSLIRGREKDAESAQSDWRKEARESYDICAGRQWDPVDRQKLRDEGRPCVEFNRTGTIIDAVSGSEVNNRQEVTFIPRVLGDAQKTGVANLRTAAAKWVRDNCDAEDEESDSFLDVLISGMGFTQTRMDYEEEEEGKVVIERVDPLEMKWDSGARKRNLSDARWFSRKCKYTREEVEAQWPDKADEIAAMAPDSDDDDATPKLVNPKNSYDGTNGESDSDDDDRIEVTHYQDYTVESVYKVLDPQSGQIVELDEERFQVASQVNPGMQYAKTPKRKYREAIICGNVELQPLGPAPCQCGFTFQAITGKRDRNKGSWYGLVRPMKDPQRWANKFFSQILHIINTNAKGGILFETGAVDNPKKLEENWARSDSAIQLKPGGLAKIQPKPIAQVPPSLYQTMEFAISSIRDSSGVNLELLGMVDRQQAGVLEAQRTRAGLTILAPFFDSLRHYRKRQGRVLAYFINEYISDGRLIRVAGPSGEQFIQLMKQPDDIDYDVVVDSAPTARDTKEQAWMALKEILPMFSQQGVQIPIEALDFMPLPESLIAALKKAYAQKLQQGQQNPMQEAEVWDKRAGAELKEAQAAKNYLDAGATGVNILAQMFGPQPNAPQPPMQQPPPPGPPQGPPPMQPPMPPPAMVQ